MLLICQIAGLAQLTVLGPAQIQSVSLSLTMFEKYFDTALINPVGTGISSTRLVYKLYFKLIILVLGL